MTTEAVRMRDGPPVTDLVTRATGGEKRAWDALVERYAPLVWSICSRHQLDNAEARDVSQTVWQQLANQLGTLYNPAGLGRWLAATTQRECDRIRRAGHRAFGPEQALDASNISGERTQTAEQELLVAERRAALREAFARLPPHCQQLITMLIQDPPVPDTAIGAQLGIPATSIRQNCHGCLRRLRRYPAIAALIHAEPMSAGSKTPGQAAAVS